MQDSDEDGRITLLILGLAVLVLAVVLTSAAATSIHIQRRQLLTCADSVSMWVAGYTSATDYYGSGELQLGQGNTRAVATKRLRELSGSMCDIGQGVRLENVEFAGRDVRVEMSVFPKLPVVGSTLPNLGQAGLIRVASTARLN